MVVRGRLAFDDQGRLVEIAEDAQDPNNPQPDEIQPVEFAEIVADGLSTELVSTGQADVADAFYTARDDAELTEVLSNVDAGDTILLGNGLFSVDRTFTTSGLIIRGTGTVAEGTRIDANWTLDAGQKLCQIGSIESNASITIAGFQSALTDSFLYTDATVTIQGDRVRYLNNNGGTVTFESNTETGLVDSCVNTSVTDNDGGNTVGDIA